MAFVGVSFPGHIFLLRRSSSVAHNYMPAAMSSDLAFHAEEEDVRAAEVEEVLRLDAEVQNKTTERG